MKSYVHQDRIWRILCFFLHPILKFFFGLDVECLPDLGPVLLICNHVTNYDPVLLAMSSPHQLLIYVASENILRGNPVLHRLLYWLFAPISRRKGTSAVDTCRNIVRTLRSGRSVCLFAEGETTWNGRTGPIKSGTDVLVRAAGVPLVTYRFRGGYLTAPRWGRGLRRGIITGRVTGVYTAEQVRAMSSDELKNVMKKGIEENAFRVQHRKHIHYRGPHRMDQAEVLLFLCPRCHQIGTLRGKASSVSCTCGFSVSYNDFLLPSTSSPFHDLCAWDEWQTSEFARQIASDSSLSIRDDQNELRLLEIASDNTVREIARGKLSMNRKMLSVGSAQFELDKIQDIALLQNRKAAFSYNNRYFEVQSPRPLCLRKYLIYWQAVMNSRSKVGKRG